MRIKNLEFRNKEIIKWIVNPYYNNEDKYIEEEDYYVLPDYPHCKIHKSCFKYPEFCISIVLFKKDSEGWNLEFIGDRPLESDVNWEDFRSLVQVGYNKLNNYKENEEI